VAKKIGRAASDIEGAVARAAADLAAAAAKAAEAARTVPVPHIPELPPVPLSRMVEVRPTVIESDHPFIAPPAPEANPAPSESAASAPVEQLADPAGTAPPAPRKRAPRKSAAVAEPAPTAEPTAAAEPAPVEQRADPAPVPEAAPAPAEPEARPAAEPVAEARPRPAEPELLPPEVILEAAVIDEPAAAPEIPEPAVSADGATRLIVTAYIGIGNRLFIRGDGPGLAWDKGVPLTFVSIGKWRWETNDATKTTAFRLFKNDTVECTALGEQRIEPGAQGEFTASF
jgi:hypothetical protein